MEILRKRRKVTPSYIFSCEKCGCIWRANEGEYVEIKCWANNIFVPIYGGFYEVYCKCPNCRKEVKMEGRYKEYGGDGIFDKYKVDLNKILETENEG